MACDSYTVQVINDKLALIVPAVAQAKQPDWPDFLHL
jgi:hypothetical protein